MLFAGIVLALAALLLAGKMLSGSAAPAPAAAATAAPRAEQPAVAPAVREPLGAPLPPNPTPVPTSAIHFTSKPIEPSYTVAANDNLWSIAQKNRTTVEAVQAINNLPDRATLSIGQKLVMP